MKRRGSVPGPARWWLAAIGCGIAFLTVACGSGSSTASGGSSSSAPASPLGASSALCADAAALRASLGKLSHIQASAGQGALNEVKADLASVKTATANFATDAKGKWQPQTSALKSALSSLGTAVQKLAANPSSAAVSSVVTALGQVTTATGNLFAAVGNDCPSGT